MSNTHASGFHHDQEELSIEKRYYVEIEIPWQRNPLLGAGFIFEIF